MWTWWLASIDIKKGQIYHRQGIQFYERNIYKNGNLRVRWGLIQVKKFPSSLTMIYQRAIWYVKFVSESCGVTCKKIELLKKLHFLVRALNKPDTSPREVIFGVCKKFITKLTDYFFTIINLGTTSFGNESLFTQQKEKFPLINIFGPMYIDFDEYPCYSGRNSEIFEKNVNENIQCVHGYAYSSGKQKMCTWVNEEIWGIINNCVHDAKPIKKIPKTVLCK